MKPNSMMLVLLIGCVDSRIRATSDGGVAPATDALGNLVRIDESVSIGGNLSIEGGALRIYKVGDPSTAPELQWFGDRGAWITGIDIANNGGSRDFVIAAKQNWPLPGHVNDVVYVAHNDLTAPTVGIGVTPPSTTHRLQISSQDDEPLMGGMSIRRTPAQVGNLFTVVDSAGTPRWWLDANYWLKGSSPATAASVSIMADDTNGRPLVVAKADGSAVYGLQYASDGSNALNLRYITGAVDNIALHADGRPSFPNGLTTIGLRLDVQAVPASASTPCTRGDMTFNNEHIYICVSTNTWRRTALGTW